MVGLLESVLLRKYPTGRGSGGLPARIYIYTLSCAVVRGSHCNYRQTQHRAGQRRPVPGEIGNKCSPATLQKQQGIKIPVATRAKSLSLRGVDALARFLFPLDHLSSRPGKLSRQVCALHLALLELRFQSLIRSVRQRSRKLSVSRRYRNRTTVCSFG